MIYIYFKNIYNVKKKMNIYIYKDNPIILV